MTLLSLCLIEAGARHLEQRSIQRTRVASLAASEHTLKKTGQVLRWGALLLACIAAMALYLAGAVLLSFGLGVIYGLFRFGIAFLEGAAAQSSQASRLANALRAPVFADARLGMFFSAVDLPRPDHVKAWDTQIDAIGLPWFIITVEPHHFAALTKEGRQNVIYLPDLQSMVHALPAGLKVMLYANNAQKNRLVLKALPDVEHVQMLHGDSDKPPSFSPLTKNFDHVFVAGQMAIDRYTRNNVHIPPEKFHIVGRPQVVDIQPAHAAIAQIKRPVVAYMPTWRGFFEDTQFSSLDRADQVVTAVMDLSRAVDVIFKPHPMSYKDPEWASFERRIQTALGQQPASGSRGQVASPDLSPFDLYNRADLLVCDISSVMIDFLYANKPLVTVLPHGFTPQMRTQFPSLEAAYPVQADLSDLAAQLEVALGEDPLANERGRVRASAFGDLDRPAGTAFQNACCALIAG